MVDDQGWVYMRIEKFVYGPKQAGIISNQDLVKHMATFGYHPVQHTSGLWVHENINTSISLVVDDFCVKYSLTDNTGHFKFPQIKICYHS